MSTYGDMQARIADELLGSLTTAQIQNAIQDAIIRYQADAFWFNNVAILEQPTVDGDGNPVVDGNGNFILSGPAFTTQNMIEFYNPTQNNSIGTMNRINRLILFYPGSNAASPMRLVMTPRTHEWMDDHSVSTTARGMPTDWSYQAEQIRLFPIPSQAWDVGLTGTMTFLAPVNDSDETVWTNEAEKLIRAEAERDLLERIIRDYGRADRMAQLVTRNEQELRKRSVNRGGPVRIRPHF